VGNHGKHSERNELKTVLRTTFSRWNQKKRGIEWRLIRKDLEKTAIAARLHGPSPLELEG